MRCEKTAKWIPLLAGDDLTGRRAARLRKHLETCPGCRRDLESEQEALAAMKAAARREPVEDWPEHSWNALMSRITSERPGTKRTALRPIPRWALASGAAATLVLAGLFLLVRNRIFRPEGISPVPGPALVEKQEVPPPQSIPSQPPEPESRETRVPETKPQILANRNTESEARVRKTAPAETAAGQDVISVTLVSQESGLQVTWFFDKNFEWKGDER